MHGRVKVRTTEEQKEIKRKEREKKLTLYKAGIAHTFKKRQNGEYDKDALEITGQLVSANPDIYTLWNFRREILLALKNTSSEEDYQNLMLEELRLTEQCLRGVNPKSYCGWQQRVWVLDNMTTPDWPKELSLCNKYLEMDERNFHVWDHRRTVVQRSKVPAEDEFAYSTSKIATNFSNYSSWHYRSRLLPLIYPDTQGKRPICEEEHSKELDLVQNACFTDPNDQSAWFYQRWLLGRTVSPLGICAAVVSPGRVCVALSQCVADVRFVVHIQGRPVDGTWSSSEAGAWSHVWLFHCSGRDLLSDGGDESYAVGIALLEDSAVVDRLSVQVTNGRGAEHRTPQFGAGFSVGLTSVLEDQLDSSLQLLAMEPDSKWTLLTCMLLMQAIDRHKYREETMGKLEQLQRLDTMRSGYYSDLRSRFVLEYAIDDLSQTLSGAAPHSEMDLSGHNLTAFYHGNYLTMLEKLNLGANKLFRSLRQLHVLQSLVELCLDDNDIEDLFAFPRLPTLQTLLLRGNKIRTFAALKGVERCTSVSVLDVTGNPIQSDTLLEMTVREFLPAIKVLNQIKLQ